MKILGDREIVTPVIAGDQYYKMETNNMQRCTIKEVMTLSGVRDPDRVRIADLFLDALPLFWFFY